MRAAAHHRNAIPLFLLSALAWGGCASAPRMQGVEDLEPGTSLAFGSARVVVDGKVQEFGSVWTRNDFFLLILPEESDQAITAPLREDGFFYWPLDPGRYTILGYAWFKGSARRTGPVYGYFVVPEDGGDVYIGDLEFAGPEHGLEFGLGDAYDEARTAYEARFPQREGRSVAGLLKPEERVGQYSRISGPCAERWEIECSDRYAGVTPTGPASSTSGFPVVATTRPEFRWEGCGLSGARYDVAVYRAAAYNIGSVKDLFTRGHLAAYVEDLATPYWTPEIPLDPDTRYFWSVRMRDGDTVSAWSTQGHSTFLLFYSSWSFGNWFEFRTPPASG